MGKWVVGSVRRHDVRKPEERGAEREDDGGDEDDGGGWRECCASASILGGRVPDLAGVGICKG